MVKKKPPQLLKERRIEVCVKSKAASTIIWDTRGCGTSHQLTSSPVECAVRSELRGVVSIDRISGDECILVSNQSYTVL